MLAYNRAVVHSVQKDMYKILKNYLKKCGFFAIYMI